MDHNKRGAHGSEVVGWGCSSIALPHWRERRGCSHLAICAAAGAVVDPMKGASQVRHYQHGGVVLVGIPRGIISPCWPGFATWRGGVGHAHTLANVTRSGCP
jgi:hypothetical protein